MAEPDSIDADALLDNAGRASRFLKVLSNPDRLMILCILARGEVRVSDIESLLGIRQPSLSQQLARLRAEGLVVTRRDGKAIYYSLRGSEAVRVIELLHDIFCSERDRSATKIGSRAGAPPVS